MIEDNEGAEGLSPLDPVPVTAEGGEVFPSAEHLLRIRLLKQMLPKDSSLHTGWLAEVRRMKEETPLGVRKRFRSLVAANATVSVQHSVYVQIVTAAARARFECGTSSERAKLLRTHHDYLVYSLSGDEADFRLGARCHAQPPPTWKLRFPMEGENTWAKALMLIRFLERARAVQDGVEVATETLDKMVTTALYDRMGSAKTIPPVRYAAPRPQRRERAFASVTARAQDLQERHVALAARQLMPPPPQPAVASTSAPASGPAAVPAVAPSAPAPPESSEGHQPDESQPTAAPPADGGAGKKKKKRSRKSKRKVSSAESAPVSRASSPAPAETQQPLQDLSALQQTPQGKAPQPTEGPSPGVILSGSGPPVEDSAVAKDADVPPPSVARQPSGHGRTDSGFGPDSGRNTGLSDAASEAPVEDEERSPPALVVDEEPKCPRRSLTGTEDATPNSRPSDPKRGCNRSTDDLRVE